MNINHWPRRAALFAGISLLAIQPAFAQTAPQDSAPPQADNGSPSAAARDDDIVITGSRIEGAKTAGALPVTVLGADRIEATGSMSGDDIFRSLPQAGDVQFQEARTTGNLNDARGDNSSINLRSLGTGNTLVLLNGRRMILTPGTQTENFVPVQTANTNSLPVGAIKRIEVLRDGAAAIYGSDAVAGVVNVVLDDRFKGVQFAGRLGFADGMREGTMSFKGGTSTKSGGSFVLFGSYTRRTPLFARERDFSSSEDHRAALMGTPWAGDTAFDNRSSSSPWGAFTVLGTTATIRQGATALTTSGVFHVEPVANGVACSSTVYNGNLCLKSGTITGAADRPLRYDENPDRTIRGGLDRVTIFSTFRQPIGGGATELYGEAGYYYARSQGQREQSAPVSSAPISVPATNYWNPFGAVLINGVANPNRLPGLVNVPAGGLALRLTNYRPVDTGPRTFTVRDDMIRGLIGLKGRWGDFRWDGAITYSWARTDDNTHNAISNTLFQQALAKSTPDAYNPFNGGSIPNFSLGDATPSDPATIRSFLIEVHRIGKTSLLTGDFRVSNPNLLNLWAGPIGFAAGVEARRETYDDNRDPRLDGTNKYTDSVTGITYNSDVLGASASPDVRAHRSVVAAYIEFAVPIVSPEMNIPLMRSLNFQLAARDENYSDFGNVLKPKVAGLWEVFKGLSLRSSWSQSFRAPNLPQFYSSGTQVSNTRTDYAQCRINGTTCSGASTLEIRSGNRGLKPENAENFSGGVVLQPLRRLQLTVDYWSIKESGVIGLQGAQNQILYDYLLRQSGKSNPNVVRLAPVGAQIVGDLSYVEDDYFNLQPRLFRGLDFSLSYDSPRTKVGTFSIDLNASKLLTYRQSPSEMQATLIAANAAGALGTGIAITAAGSQIKIDGNPEWRASANLTWRLGGFSLGTLVTYVGSVFDTGPALVNGQFFDVGSYTTANVWAQYRFGKNSALSGLSLRAGVRNLFDREPSLYSSNYGFLGSINDPVGRFAYFEVSAKF
ncbi:MAG: TonB-dependent receptor [Proteobacteria bacterium]|nr:TonB-dependent receptor [Pseudomonadota bacterium]